MSNKRIKKKRYKRLMKQMFKACVMIANGPIMNMSTGPSRHWYKVSADIALPGADKTAEYCYRSLKWD